MKYLLYLTVCIVATWCTACQDNSAAESMTNDIHPRFVLSRNVQTRVSYPEIEQSTFEEGDIVGAFALTANGQQDSKGHALYDLATGTTPNAQYEVVKNGNSLYLEPVIKSDVFPAGSQYTYVFYYPFKEGVSLSDEGKVLITHSVEADQTTQGRYERSDLLWDVTRQSESSTAEAPIVDVAMDHLMTHLVFRIKKNEFSTSSAPQTVTGVEICDVKTTISEINLTLPMTDNGYDLEGTEATLEANVKMWDYPNSTDSEGEWKTFRAATPAGTFHHSEKRDFFRVTITDGNNSTSTKTYQSAFPNGVTFLPGRYYLFTVENGDLRFRGLIKDLENGGDHYYEY